MCCYMTSMLGVCTIFSLCVFLEKGSQVVPVYVYISKLISKEIDAATADTRSRVSFACIKF